MGFGDFVGDVVDGAKDFAGGVAEGAQDFAGGVANGAQNLAGGVVNQAQRFASDPIGTITAPFGGGDPSGNDGGSSNWAAWGHEEMRSMLDDTVTPEDIDDGARAWSNLQGEAANLVTTSTRDLRQRVSNGWRGESADAAIRSLGPVDDWANTLLEAMGNTAQLMDTSGSAAGQAKATVPPAQSHDWGESLTSFATGGGPGALVDAVAQDRAQEEARMEAVRIMNTAYSAPINESRAAVPTYPQLADPTLQPPEHPPISGPHPGGGGGAGGGGGVPGGGLPGGGGVPGGGVPRSGSYHPPAVTHAQGVPDRPGSSTSPVPTPPQYTGPRSPGGPGGAGPGGAGPGGGGPAGRFGPDASAGVPIAPLGGAGAGGDVEGTRRGFRGGGLGSGRSGGLGGRAGTGSAKGTTGFGPRGSAAAGAVEGAAEGGRFGTAAAGGRGGAGAAGVPLAGAGAGRGQGGEDNEHQRPSYLVETDDIFGDGRKVAPPVIGEDPPAHYR